MRTSGTPYNINTGNLTAGEQLQLVRCFSRYLKLKKVGFPAVDARNMAGLQDEDVYIKAFAAYKSYL